MKVLLYYLYSPLDDPQSEVRDQRALCEKLNLKGRILISKDGINGTCCGEETDIEKYKEAMRRHPVFHEMTFKESTSDVQVFPKLRVRERPELVTLRKPVDVRNRAKYISPDDLHRKLLDNEDVIMVDMRNDYESAIGRFKNAMCVPMKNFRDLPDCIDFLKPYKASTIVTYCTGGVRCETASALLREEGFEHVYQLEGGIVTYLEKYPDGFFEGSCFVFDDRMAIRYDGQKDIILTNCEYCKEQCDRYIDCAILDCNRLFLCCESCARKYDGQCCDDHVGMKVDRTRKDLVAA